MICELLKSKWQGKEDTTMVATVLRIHTKLVGVGGHFKCNDEEHHRIYIITFVKNCDLGIRMQTHSTYIIMGY